MQSCLTQASIPIEKGRLRAMLVHLLRTKILRAEVTGARLDYEGSLAIDQELLDLVGMLPYERILIGNLANGQRFETYAIPAPAGDVETVAHRWQVERRAGVAAVFSRRMIRRLRSARVTVRGFQAGASAAGTSAKLMMTSRSPGWPRWAVAPLRQISRVPAGAGMA